MGSGSEEILGRRLFLWASKSSKSIHFLLDFHFLAGPPPLSLSVWLASLHSTYSLSCVAPLSLCSLALSRSFALSPRVLDASVQVLRTFEGVLIGITSLHPPLARPALFLPLFSHSHFTLPLTPSGYGWSSSYLNTYQSSPPPSLFPLPFGCVSCGVIFFSFLNSLYNLLLSLCLALVLSLIINNRFLLFPCPQLPTFLLQYIPITHPPSSLTLLENRCCCLYPCCGTSKTTNQSFVHQQISILH
ncbi:hypothetical protein ASPTUDRAFT_240945 [Aspergillus tubingensis CBS 134.48]|uniref:Uncharacterized protein n=1 Tax=Aspergillus tubingensis (strain CBS 134.48) TaxID=767770 RepID=A0A1L9NMB7_ASPTC|nr:hypothetical protein ASPTUDRAFT_240945 [Aspergillus tubingensis CBS 134.48]